MNAVTSRAATTPIIRRAKPADLPRMGRLGALLVETHHAFDTRRFLAPNNRTPDDYASFLGTHLNDPDVCIFAAEDNGEVIGYAFARLEGYDYISLRGPAGFVHDIIVDLGYRGRGVARRLLETTLAELSSRGAPRVVLSTAEGNEAAQRLFSSMGFRRTMIEMTRELDEPSR